jgi:uncharacterized protein
MMEKPDKRIVDFIRKHHVLTLATSIEGKPWCANCFYAYSEEENAFVFTSDESTRHIREALVNNSVAGSIVLETEVIGKIQGIQFEGMIMNPTDSAQLRGVYLKRFPYAIVNTSPYWGLALTQIKFTDNLLGFGKKLIWKKEAVNSPNI